MPYKNNVLIILGMHRSGTSSVANWLHACGLHLGKRLIGASVGNEKGHFEDLDFHDLHEEIFRSNNVPYGGTTKIPQLHISRKQVAKCKALIQHKNTLHINWGWKDPRTCLFIDMYEKFIDGPTYLILYRDATEVVNSLLKRREEMFSSGYYSWRIVERLKYYIKNKTMWKFPARMAEKEYTGSWIQYNEKIIHLTENIDKDRYKVVYFPDLLKNSQDVISWLNERNFNLKEILFEEVFDKSMISTKNMKIKIDADLSRRVQDIERNLSELAGCYNKLESI